MRFTNVLADKVVTYMAVTTLILALMTFAKALIW
jgi:hypothetical protein